MDNVERQRWREVCIELFGEGRVSGLPELHLQAFVVQFQGGLKGNYFAAFRQYFFLSPQERGGKTKLDTVKAAENVFQRRWNAFLKSGRAAAQMAS